MSKVSFPTNRPSRCDSVRVNRTQFNHIFTDSAVAAGEKIASDLAALKDDIADACDKRFVFFKNKKVSLLFGLGFCLFYCLMLILAIKPFPVNDSKTLDDIINQFMTGDYSSLTETGGYLFIWPFQLGYVAFGQIVCTIFGIGNYLAWDLIQLLSVFITPATAK